MSSNKQDEFRVLVFSKTAKYRHDSIPAGIEGLRRLGAAGDPFTFEIEASEDAAAVINPTSLARFRVVVFLSTSGEFLTSEQVGALRAYVQAGGGFVGIHCASSGMESEPWYGELVGAYFAGHPVPQDGVVRVENPHHPIAAPFAALAEEGGKGKEEFKWHDEWYNFKSNPREKVTVLLSTDETSYEGGKMGKDHPLAWCREFDGGRTFYTSLGHFDEAFSNDTFMAHVLRGILWVAGIL